MSNVSKARKLAFLRLMTAQIEETLAFADQLADEVGDLEYEEARWGEMLFEEVNKWYDFLQDQAEQQGWIPDWGEVDAEAKSIQSESFHAEDLIVPIPDDDDVPFTSDRNPYAWSDQDIKWQEGGD